jgi:hypothetical protein
LEPSHSIEVGVLPAVQMVEERYMGALCLQIWVGARLVHVSAKFCCKLDCCSYVDKQSLIQELLQLDIFLLAADTLQSPLA